MVDFFRAQNQQTQQPNNQQVNQQNTSSLENAANNVNNQQQTNNNATVNDTNKQSQNPLDTFKGLWDSDTKQQAEPPKGVLPAITAEQLNKTLANSNFLSSVDPELLKKASAGDAQAFSDVINSGLRTVLTQSVLASHGLVEQGTRSHGEQLKTTLPSMVRSSNVSDSLQANPIYNNPAAKPMVDMVRAQLEAKNPQASAREIAEMTQEFITSFAKVANPEKVIEPKKGQTAEGETDWYSVLGLEALQTK